MAEKVRFHSIHDLRQWCADDFRNYMNYRCTRLKFSASEIHLRCAGWLQNGRRFKKIMGWRGCAKTTWFGIEYICWRFLRKPQTKVIVQCLKPDAPVTMADGTECRIDALSVGDFVLGGSGHPRQVLNVLSRPHDGAMLRIKLWGLCYPLELTAEHRVPTADGWKVAGELKKGDLLREPEVPISPGGDFDIGWIVGLYLAEGSRSRGPKNTWNETTFTVHEREVQRTHDALSAFCSRKVNTQIIKNSKAVMVRTSDPSLRKLVDDWVSGNSSRAKALTRLPTEWDFASGIIEGWLDGDGYPRGKGRAGQTSSRSLATQMLLIASSLDRSSNLTTGVNCPGPRERAAGMMFPVNRYWIALSSPRTGNYKQTRVIDGIAYRPVSSVETFEYQGTVFDLTVDVDHTFISNGVVISNCNTDTNAGLTTSAVKQVLVTDPLFEVLYPRGQTADHYFNLHNFKPEKGYSIRCAGVETTLTSERADLFVIDDPESGDPEAKYDRIIEIFDEAQVILFRQGRLFPGMECPIPERTQRLVMGQPHWEGSAYYPPPPDPNTGDVDDHPLRSDDTFVIPAMVNSSFDPDDEIECLSSVPEIRSDEEMRQEKATLSRRKWRLNMMLRVDPEDAERAVIPLNHITVRLASPAYIIMVVDPADGGDCEWGLAAGGLYRLQYHICFMDGITELEIAKNEGLDPNHETIGSLMWKKVFDLCDDYEVDAIYIEANWAPAIKALRRYLAKHGHAIVVHEFHSHMKKLYRIISQWEMPTKNGQISCNPIVMADAQNRKQMSNLRHHRLPSPCDRIDAAGKLLDILSESSVTDTVDDSDKLRSPGQADAFGEQDVTTARDPLRTRRVLPMRSRASRLRRV